MSEIINYKIKNFSLKSGVESSKNFSFAINTTYGCGGAARLALYPKNIPQAKLAYSIASDGRFCILGNGSNVLAADDFFDGVVISTKKLQGIYKVNGDTLCVLAGTKISKLLNYCVRNRLGGLEYLYGIPATVGGAAYMNAGSGGKYVGEDVLKVRIFDGKIRDLTQKECNFKYKHSTMRDINCIILAVFIKINTNCDANLIKQKIDERAAFRTNLPKGKSCGCVFKNADGISAGKLIQRCNLADTVIGKAKVSAKHCNFIINCGYRSQDVRKLISLVKSEVYKQTCILLEEEVIYIGDFNEFDG